MSFLHVHKPGQARLSRLITLLCGLFMIAWGCRSLLRTIGDPSIWPQGSLALNQGLLGQATDKEAWRLNPILNEVISPALVIAAVLFAVLAIAWWRFLNRERWADLLIDMEAELRKVSWPTPSDAWQSTLVVTGFTVSVIVTILVYDLVIKGFIELFVQG